MRRKKKNPKVWVFFRGALDYAIRKEPAVESESKWHPEEPEKVPRKQKPQIEMGFLFLDAEVLAI